MLLTKEWDKRMKEILNILIPVCASVIISLILYLITKRKKLATVFCIIILLLSSVAVYIINTKEVNNKDNGMQATTEEIWKLIEVNYKIGNYERMIQIAEENQLMESEEMLNVLGVMYAQGIYYEQDFEKALAYLDAAAIYGNLENTFINLWLVSYMTDWQKKENINNPYSNCIRALDIAEKHNNNLLNNMLTIGISLNFDESVENGYEYVKLLSAEDKQILFNAFYQQVGTIKYIVCTEYHYYADVSKNLVSGITEYSNIVAMPHKLEEWEVPIYIFVGGCPANFVLFEDIALSPFASSEHTVTDTFEYETSYIDERGNTCYWIDTDEIFYGDVPPETDENSRWVIMGYGNTYTERRFKLQIKSE